MSALLVAVILFTMAMAFWRLRSSAIVLVFLLGLAVYSIPAILGLTVTPGIGQQRPIIIDASPESIMAMTAAWLGFLTVLLFWSLTYRPSTAVVAQGAVHQQAKDRFIATCAATAVGISALLFAVMMARNGMFFFLNSTSELSRSLGFDYLIWRWVNLYGVLFAISARSPLAVLYFAFQILINMIIGDRTVITLSLAATFALTFRPESFWRIVRRPSYWIYAVMGASIIAVAKPLYVSLKEGVPLSSTFGAGADQTLLSFEPLGIHYILDRVIAYNLNVDLLDVLRGCLGQALLIPSLFGVDSSAFNVQVTQALYNSRLTYGIASNFWAQGFALAGYSGVFIFGLIFGVLAVGLESLRRRGRRLSVIFLISVATITGIYIHRNSLENYLSFVRQLVIAFGIITLSAAAMVKARETRASRRQP